jgi:cell division protein FtsB
MRTTLTRRAAVTVALCVPVYVLGLLQTTSAQPKTSHEPFANTVAQQSEMIQQLKEINQQLKDQNALLRSGRLTVVVAPPPAK